jgi:hypothetical protein
MVFANTSNVVFSSHSNVRLASPHVTSNVNRLLASALDDRARFNGLLSLDAPSSAARLLPTDGEAVAGVSEDILNCCLSVRCGAV